MGIKILEAEDADYVRVFEITSLAFARNEPFYDAVYPEHWLQSGREAGGERMRQMNAADPYTTFLKAVDESTGEIVGMAKWNVYDNGMPDFSHKDLGDWWQTPEDKEFATEMFPIFIETRKNAIIESKGNLVSLDILTIDPNHQRNGVGGALVKWGTDIADKNGVEAVVESSVYGKGLYEKNGFVFIKDVTLEMPEKWKAKTEGQKPNRFAWLIRPRQASK